MKRLRFIFVALVFITSFVFSAISHPVQAIEIISISTPEELNDIRNNLSGHYQLINDIDLSTFGNWVPIGTLGAGFSGSFDGKGYTIKNLSVSHPTLHYLGLFGEIRSSGIVTNLQITSASVSGYNHVGILAGLNYGLIANVAVHGVVNGMGMVGGLSGYNNGSVDQTYSISSITANSNFGGLIGYNLNTISNSYSASSITKLSTFIGGGLVGYNSNTNLIINSYYDTNVSGLSDTGKGNPLTTAEMKSDSSFHSTWDFVNTWHIIENETYPSLFPFPVTIEKADIQPDPAITSPIDFITTFDNPIDKTGFSAEDVVLAGTAGADQVDITEITPNNGTTFKLSVSGMTGDGTVTVSIPEGKVIDALHNFNLPGTSHIVSYEPDTTPPTVSISSTTTSPTNSSSIPISITFSEDVIGFTILDIQVTNGTLENFSGSGKAFTADLIPSSNGTVSVNIPAEVAEDAAGNGNTAADPFTIKYDRTPPVVTISSVFNLNPYNLITLIIDVKFNEFVSGFGMDDIHITSGSKYYMVTLESGRRYHVFIDQITDGPVTVVVPEGAVTDSAGNRNQSSNQLSIEYDTTPPTATINQASSQNDPTNSQPINFIATFSEPIRTNTFGVEDLTISGISETPTVTISEITPHNGTTFNIAVSGLAQSGMISVKLLKDVVFDLAYNGNLQSTSTDNSIEFDITDPTVTISTSVSDPTNLSPIPISIEFSESVNGFDLADISVSNGTAENFSGSGETYTLDVTPTDDGLITISISENIAQDLAGNPNVAATPLAITFDKTHPSVSIEKAELQTDSTNMLPILFSVKFSKPIFMESFTVDDFNVEAPAGATITSIIELEPNDDTTFEVLIDGMKEDGLVTLSLPEGKVQDLAGNDNTTSTSNDNSVLYDTQSPLIEKIDIEKFYEGNPPDQFEITFSESMYNPEGDNDPDDITNPANYLLVEWGENAIFDTTSCEDGSQEDDQLIKITSVTYDEDALISTLKLPHKLQEGSYRLFVCGSATLYDTAMNPFNNGLDSIYSFIVLSEPAEEEQEKENSNSSQFPTLLPETGFPIGQTTLLAKQHTTQLYKSTKFELEIPGSNGKTSVVGVPLVDGDWDISWLGNQAGYLYSSAYPTWQGNTVITGHVWNANNTPGIFFNLKTLKYGDLIRIHAYGMVYTYEVRENRLISETNLNAAFHPEEYDWITLLTCEGYQLGDKSYAARRMVKAVLVSVE